MSISVIIPTYNGSRFLSETVQSVISQTYTDWELVIVDDGSTDRTPEIIRFFIGMDRRIHCVTTTNRGESAARNAGFSASSPCRPYVIFLDHDDVWLPSCLEELLNRCECEPSAVGAHAIATAIGIDGNLINFGNLEYWGRLRKCLKDGQIVDCGPNDPTELATLVYHVAIVTMGLCILRRSALPVLPFREDMKTGSGDLYLYLRMACAGKFAFLDEIVIRKRIHENNLSANQSEIQESVLRAFSYVWQASDTSEDNRNQMQRAFLSRKRSNVKNFLFNAIRQIAHLKPGEAICSVKQAKRCLREMSIRRLAMRFAIDN